MAPSVASFTLVPGGQVISEADYDPAFYHGIVWQLPKSLGVLVIGLVFISISFWKACFKALEYSRHANADHGRGTEATVTCLTMLSLAQFIIAVYKVYHSVVTDFGEVIKLLDDTWTAPIEILLMVLSACVAQGFFTHRLHTITRNQLINKSSIAFILAQFAMAIISVAEMFQRGYGSVMIFNHGYFSTYAMFGISAGIDIALACVLFLVAHSPTRKRETALQMAQYWTFGSLMACGVLSIFASIMLSVAGLTLVWLVTAFVLGNLYALSVPLSLMTTFRRSDRVKYTSQFSLRRPSVVPGGLSTPTLTNDVEFRHASAEAIQVSELTPAPAPATATITTSKDRGGKLEYVLGYHSEDGVERNR